MAKSLTSHEYESSKTTSENRIKEDLGNLPCHFGKFDQTEFRPRYLKSKIDTLKSEPEFVDLEREADELKFVFHRFENRKKTLLALFGYLNTAEENDGEDAIHALDEIIAEDPTALVAIFDRAWMKINSYDLETSNDDLEQTILDARNIYENKDYLLDKLIADAEICHFHERVGPDHFQRAIEGFRAVIKSADEECPAAGPYAVIWKYELADLINRIFNKNVVSKYMELVHEKNGGIDGYLEEASQMLKSVVSSSEEFRFMKARAWVMVVYVHHSYVNLRQTSGSVKSISEIAPHGKSLEQCLEMVEKLGTDDYYSMERLGRFYRTLKDHIDLEKAENILKKAIELRETPYVYHQLGLLYQDQLNKMEKSNVEPPKNQEGPGPDGDELRKKMANLKKKRLSDVTPPTADGLQLAQTTKGLDAEFEPRYQQSIKPRSTSNYLRIKTYPVERADIVQKIVENFQKASEMTHDTVPLFMCDYVRWSASLALTNSEEDLGKALSTPVKKFRRNLDKMEILPRNVAYCYETLAQVMKLTGRKKDAEVWYREAITARLSYGDKPSLSFYDLHQLIANDHDVSSKNTKLAKLYELVEDYPSAISFLEKEIMNEKLAVEDEQATLLSMARNYSKLSQFSEAELVFYIYMLNHIDEQRVIPENVRDLYLDIKFGVLKYISNFCRQSDALDPEESEVPNDDSDNPKEEYSYLYEQILNDVLLRAPPVAECEYDFYIAAPEELSAPKSKLKERSYELYRTIMSFGISKVRCCLPRKTFLLPGSHHHKQDAYIYILPLIFDTRIDHLAWTTRVFDPIMQNEKSRAILLIQYEDTCPLDDVCAEVAGTVDWLKTKPIFKWHKYDTDSERKESLIRAIIHAKYGSEKKQGMSQ